MSPEPFVMSTGLASTAASPAECPVSDRGFWVSNGCSIDGVSAVKGDRVEIVVDIGEGTRSYEVVATRAGRRVEVANRRGLVEVSEVTRTGTPVRTARFMASRIISLVEYPASDKQVT
jgi:hypothetical protein